nr:probable 4-coumarate--CoA ligase 1 [Leptinotarsa decemlineata]
MPDIEFGSTNDLAFLPYSSGTTGLPKGVELTHNNLVSMNAQAIHPDYQLFDTPSETFQDIIPGVLPMFHIYGFTILALNGLVNGSKLLTIPRFQPDLFISMMKHHKVTVVYAAPPLALFMAQHEDIKSEYFSKLKFLMSGAAPLGSMDEERLQNKLGKDVPILQGYGMTESSGIVTICASKILMKSMKDLRGSVGKPVPNTFIKVVGVDDTTGEQLGPNEPGEIWIKGPQIMRGYFKKPKETEAALKNGWLKSGDIGYYNEKKLLFITDRLKELIKVKGFQVAPAELEGILREFPAVKEAAVVGVPHPVLGEAPKAYIVPKSNMSLDPEELHRFVAERVAKYKQLTGGIEFVESIPKNPSGKILRRLLNKS